MIGEKLAEVTAKVETSDDGNLRLIAPFTVDLWDAPGIINAVSVPQDFVTDGATIPRFLWPFVGPPMRGGYLVPAIVHDYLCVMAATYQQRVMADGVFFALLHRYKVPAWKRCAMYLGVRFYARLFWRQKAGVK